MAEVTRIGPDQLSEAAATPGMRRWQAAAGPSFWSGIVETHPDLASGWHHHGDYHTLVYLLAGRMRIEWGEGGGTATEAGRGDFLLIPPHTIHREVNPDPQEAQAIVVRIGEGEPVFNVAEPEPGE